MAFRAIKAREGDMFVGVETMSRFANGFADNPRLTARSSPIAEGFWAREKASAAPPDALWGSCGGGGQGLALVLERLS
jgi:hypothetical protein